MSAAPGHSGSVSPGIPVVLCLTLPAPSRQPPQPCDTLCSVRMSAFLRSGAAVRLLVVLCVTAGCAAAQEQQGMTDSPMNKMNDSSTTKMSTEPPTTKMMNNSSTTKMMTDPPTPKMMNDSLTTKMSTEPPTPKMMNDSTSNMMNDSSTTKMMTESPTTKMMDDTQTGKTTVGPDQMDIQNSSDIRDCSDLPNESPSDIYSTRYGDVFCDMDTTWGGWTVFQRRVSSDGPNFRRGKWEAYKAGFGDLLTNHWLGLETLYKMTGNASENQFEMRVDLEDFEGNTAYALYQGFSISSEDKNYSLSISSYNGTASDGMTDAAGHAFSTRDRDNRQPDIIKQLETFGFQVCDPGVVSAWWRFACSDSNLNGDYAGKKPNFVGIWWTGFPSGIAPEGLKRTEMKFRRISH